MSGAFQRKAILVVMVVRVVGLAEKDGDAFIDRFRALTQQARASHQFAAIGCLQA